MSAARGALVGIVARLSLIRVHAGDILERGNRCGAAIDDDALEILNLVHIMLRDIEQADQPRAPLARIRRNHPPRMARTKDWEAENRRDGKVTNG